MPGTALPLAVSLPMILARAAYATLKAPKRPFLPTALWPTITHGNFAFGLVAAGAVMWQPIMGEVPVPWTLAVLVLGAVAAGIVNSTTIEASLLAPARPARGTAPLSRARGWPGG